MKMEYFKRQAKTWILTLCLVTAYPAGSVVAETRYASPEGRANNSGTSRSAAWNAESCFTRLAPGDKCIYLDGNYGGQNFAPTNSGQANARIVHECESLHACRFDRIVLEDVAHLTVEKIASDTHYYDKTKSYTNPRMGLYGAHHLKFDSIYVRGEPQICADGNPGPDCKGSSEYKRYNDLLLIGKSDQSKTAWMIEITGRTELIDGNHSVIEAYDDRDSRACEDEESDIWIHGTPDTPIKMSSKFHHVLSVKGSCRVLVEHVDFGPGGTGRGDLNQPQNSTSDQAGGLLHTSSARHLIVRFSNFRKGGSATDGARNNSHIEVGMFGEEVVGACFSHNSHHQPWGTFATIGRLNEMKLVRDVSILNNAVSSPWHMNQRNPSAATSPYNGFAIARAGKEDFVAADIDGVVISAGTSVQLYDGLQGRTRSFSDSVSYMDGIQFGATFVRDSNPIFQQPNNWNFQPISGSPLVGSAVPIATTTSAGAGKDIPVDRPECFAGTMNGMRSGDIIDVGGQRCTVTDVDIPSATLTCSESINWSNNAEIFYTLGGSVMRDIGSQASGGNTTTSLDPGDFPPKAPILSIEN